MKQLESCAVPQATSCSPNRPGSWVETKLRHQVSWLQYCSQLEESCLLVWSGIQCHRYTATVCSEMVPAHLPHLAVRFLCNKSVLRFNPYLFIPLGDTGTLLNSKLFQDWAFPHLSGRFHKEVWHAYKRYRKENLHNIHGHVQKESRCRGQRALGGVLWIILLGTWIISLWSSARLKMYSWSKVIRAKI